MTHDLTVEDFAAFFEEVHGCEPFPWQMRLVRRVADEGRWPDVLDLPTGSGKTAALDVAIFHLALEATRGAERRAPVRVALVVDRRLVVDDAFERAKKIVEALNHPEPGSTTARVAHRLRLLAGEGNPPLLARRLRGGIPREDDWARTPSQPTILCSTVDQVGSRLLFRGYGVSNSMKPIHAGLVGADCLILLDEAHLSEPFRQTLKWVQGYKSESWRESKDQVAPWGVSLLTATLGKDAGVAFGLDDEDHANSVLHARWCAPKPAWLVEPSKLKQNADAANEDGETGEVADKQRIEELVKLAVKGLEALKEQSLDHSPALAIVVNRVARARAVFEELRKKPDADEIESILMIGPSRSIERDELARRLDPIKTGHSRRLDKPLLIVSTQCIEAGVDIDLDGLITEAAPLDALRQRFGRLNRAGREMAPYAAIVSGGKSDKNDPVYGEAIVNTWSHLKEHAGKPATKKELPKVDFGLAALEEFLEKHPVTDPLKPEDLLSPKPDAPVLLPAHLDLLSQTAPIPTADPEVSLYLHGPSRAADAVTVVWRADVDASNGNRVDTYQLLRLAPPRSSEAIELPAWAVKRWLTDPGSGAGALADIPSSSDESESRQQDGQRRRVFRWTGDLDSSKWTDEIHAGHTLVVPASYGGIETDGEKGYGWNPSARQTVRDVGHKAACAFAGRGFAVRVAPGLLKEDCTADDLAEAIAMAGSRWRDLRDAVAGLVQPDVADALEKLSSAKKGRVEFDSDLYGKDENERPRGIVFMATLGIKNSEEDAPGATEDDWAGSLPGFPQTLEEHTAAVGRMASMFAIRSGMPEPHIQDITLAAHLHDAGKTDPRFQALLAYGDPLGPEPDKVLAKSACRPPRNAWERSDLPMHWRHEALSVRLAPCASRFSEAKDQELVLWLIGTHHGHGRPFFPHADPEDDEPRTGLPTVLGIPSTLSAGPGPQSLAYDWNGWDWPGLYERLKDRYGVWELARMEAILRLADHRASEQAARVQDADEGGGQ